jgi:hypothetical protein
MTNAAAVATRLNSSTAFADIKWDKTTQWNTVYCSNAQENFRAGESVQLHPPVNLIGTTYISEVGAILKVNAASNPPRVLLSLFLNLSKDMAVRHQPPDGKIFVQYPSKHVVWTRFQGWYPVSRIRSEAYLVSPWEVNEARNAAYLCYGMTNAYCIMAKWNHEIIPPRSAFHAIGNEKQYIPGCLHLINFESVTHRSWSFRREVASQIALTLSKSSDATRTKQSIHIRGIPLVQWDHFKKHTIPLEATARKSILTTRIIRRNLVIEMMKHRTINHFARFDTTERLSILKGYFGSGIEAAACVPRFAGPKVSRGTDPAPAFLARHLQNQDTVGAIIRLPEQPTVSYHSQESGIDLLYYPEKQQLTVRVRYTIDAVDDPIVRQQLLGLPPLPAPNNAAPQLGAPAVVPDAEFEYQGSVFIVCHVTDDGVVCEVQESNDDNLEEEDEVILPFNIVQEAVIDYYARQE